MDAGEGGLARALERTVRGGLWLLAIGCFCAGIVTHQGLAMIPVSIFVVLAITFRRKS